MKIGEQLKFKLGKQLVDLKFSKEWDDVNNAVSSRLWYIIVTKLSSRNEVILGKEYENR